MFIIIFDDNSKTKRKNKYKNKYTLLTKDKLSKIKTIKTEENSISLDKK